MSTSNSPNLSPPTFPPLMRSSSDRVISDKKLSLAFKLRRAVSLDKIVNIELPILRDVCRSEESDVSLSSMSSDSLESGLGPGSDPSQHLLATETDKTVIRSKGSSPISEAVIIHNERSGPSSCSSVSSAAEFKLLKHKETSSMLGNKISSKKRVDSRRYRVLPKSSLEWSDEITGDEDEKMREKQKFTGPPRIVPTHLRDRDIEWTDDTDLDIKVDEVLPRDPDTQILSERHPLSEKEIVSHNFDDSSDDEFHSTHSDISCEELSKLVTDNSNESPCRDSANSDPDSEAPGLQSGGPRDSDFTLPIEESPSRDDIKPVSRISSSSSKSGSGSLTSKSLTLPTKHLVL